MVTRIRGFRGKSRNKMQKHFRKKGKISLTRYLTEYNEGDRVTLLCDPAVQHGMYHPRFHGKVGKIGGKIGQCYQVNIADFNKAKTLIVHPIHLKQCQDQKL